jgi:hypothetical protein
MVGLDARSRSKQPQNAENVAKTSFFARKDRKFGGNCQAFNLDKKNAF